MPTIRTGFLLFFLSLALTAPAWGEMRKVFVPLDADGVQRVEIVGGEYFFDPGHLVVKVNIPVELKVRKESWIVPHNITANSPEAGIVFEESLGRDPTVIRFTPTKPGNYPIYCNKKPPFLASHREKGMEGVIEVVGELPAQQSP